MKSQMSLNEAKTEETHYPYLFSSWQLCIHIILPFHKQIPSEWKIKINTASAAWESKTTLKMLNLKATFSITILNTGDKFPSVLTDSDYCLDLEFALPYFSLLLKLSWKPMPRLGESIIPKMELSCQIPDFGWFLGRKNQGKL